MKKICRRVFFCFLSFTMILSFFGCAPASPKNTQTYGDLPLETNPLASTDSTATQEPAPALPENMNPLTGLECREELVGQRPVSIVFNNLKDALPQSGLSGCDIIYEALAEGGVLRLEGIVLDYANVGKLGSVRSARPYLVEIALAYDAIFVHAGGSTEAYDLISRLKVNDLDGVKNGPFYANGVELFWRDQYRLEHGYAYEHTMFTSGANAVLGIGAKSYRTNLSDSTFTAFRFDPAFSGISSGKSATYLKIPHSNYSVSEFQYDADKNQYLHRQYNQEHVDGENGAQVATENVFVLFTQQSLIPNGAGKRIITLTGEGTGYYLNGGEYTQIRWKRESETAPFHYYNVDGSELAVQCGKSYVSIVDQSSSASIVIS